MYIKRKFLCTLLIFVMLVGLITPASASAAAAEIDPKTALDSIKVLPELTESDKTIKLPDVPEGLTLKVVGSDYESVVTNDGTILGTNIGAREVALLLQMEETANPTNNARKNLTVTVPDHSNGYPADWFKNVDSPNKKPDIIPSIQEWYGYQGTFTLTTNSKIIINDAADVGLMKVAENMQADILKISKISLQILEGTEQDVGVNDIYLESLTDKNKYALGDEGYVLRTDDKGIHIYAPTYIGCLYGTVTVEQILWLGDGVSVPMGIMRDYPQYEVRGMMLDTARVPFRKELLKDYSKIFAWYKLNEMHVNIASNQRIGMKESTDENYLASDAFFRIQSEKFPGLKSDTRKSSIADLTDSVYYGDMPGAGFEKPSYSKADWRTFEKRNLDYGIKTLVEFSAPGNAMPYLKYAMANPDDIAWLNNGEGASGKGWDIAPDYSISDFDLSEDAQLTEEGMPAEKPTTKTAVAFKLLYELYNEFYDRENPVFSNDEGHVGSSEFGYTSETISQNYLNLMEMARKTAINNGKSGKMRVWSFFEQKKMTEILPEDANKYYTVDLWNLKYDSPQRLSDADFKVVNCVEEVMHVWPGIERRGMLSAEWMFYNWDPTYFNKESGWQAKPNLLKGDPNLLGAKVVMWGEDTNEGLLEKDINQRLVHAAAILSEKTWGGTPVEEDFQSYELKAAKLATGPNTNIAMEVESETGLVLRYDFDKCSSTEQTVFDMSGNSYNGTISGGKLVKEDDVTYLEFDGTSVLNTDLRSLPYPFSVSFDIKLDSANKNVAGDNNALFSGYDGRLQAVGYQGGLSANMGSFIRDFEYQIPDDEKVNITIVGTLQGTKLYVNGEFKILLSQESESDGNRGSMFSSMVLPLEKIGENFKGKLANIRVYNKALNPQQIALYETPDPEPLVNVAQDTLATGSRVIPVDSDHYYYDNDPQARVTIGYKAIDGDGYVNGYNGSEMNSYWFNPSYEDNAYLLVDMQKVHEIDHIEIQWCMDEPWDLMYASDFKILASTDNITWNEIYSEEGNTEGTSVIELAVPVSARYVKMQGVTSNEDMWTYGIQEFLVCERVEKYELGSLCEVAEKLVAENGYSYESTGEALALYEATMFARAMLDNPVATKEDIKRALDALNDFDIEVPDPVVKSVTITPAEVTLFRGIDTQQFTAEVIGEFYPSQKVTWSVEGATASTITESGLLTVEAAEEADEFIVKATSVANSEIFATAKVTVRNEETTIHFDTGTGGGKNAILEDVSISIGEEFTPETEPIRVDGFVLEGWYLDEACTKKVTFPYVVTAETTFHAKWKFAPSKKIFFEDDFEGDGIDYTVWLNSGLEIGRESVNSADYSHTGEKSFHVRPGKDQIKKTFPEPVNGKVTVWYYDTMEKGTTQMFMVQDTSADPAMAKNTVGIVINNAQFSGDYALRNGNSYVSSNVKRTKGWHEFVIDCSSGKDVKRYIDSKLVDTKVGFIKAVDNIYLGSNWSTGTSGVINNANGYYDTLTVETDMVAATYTVTFEARNGSEPVKEEVSEGSTVKRPTDPVRDGYTFAGWYKDSDCTEVWNFESDVVEADITLYAKWTEDTEKLFGISIAETEGGTVTADRAEAAEGDVVTLTFKPNDGFHFVSATFNDTAIEGNSFQMPAADVTITAMFAEHTYAATWSSDAEGHWHECTVCGVMQEETKAAHTPDRAEATETEPIKCVECGYIIKDIIPHTHEYNKEVATEKYLKTEATCTEAAEYYRSCSCGKASETETFTYGNVLGHSFTNYVSNKDATCTKEGTETAKCDRCDAVDTRTEVGSKKPHTYAETWSKDAEGHWHECTMCGTMQEETKVAHTPDRAEATETEPIKCTECGYIIEDTIIHTHEYNKEVATEEYLKTEATCTEVAEYYRSCSCGKASETETFTYGNVLGHSFTNYVSNKDATCTKEGTETAKCDRCDAVDTRTEVGSKKPHTYAETWSKDTEGHWHECTMCGTMQEETKVAHTPDRAEATETEPIKCTECGYIIKDIIPHTHKYNKEVATEKYLKAEATCTEAAEYYRSCSCGKASETETFTYGNVLGHSFTNYVSNKDATCTKEGTETAKCDRCDAVDTRTEVGSKKPHTYAETWSKDSEGHWHECTMCGTMQEETKVAHTPDRAEATETEPIKCTECGYTIKDSIPHTPPKHDSEHTHNSDSVWVSDADQHWHVCDCGDIIDKEAHTPGKDGVCTGCGKVLFTPDGSADGNSQSPNTGDTMNALPLVALLAAAFAAVAVVVRRRRLIK